jgi:hypothetical protein
MNPGKQTPTVVAIAFKVMIHQALYSLVRLLWFLGMGRIAVEN